MYFSFRRDCHRLLETYSGSYRLLQLKHPPAFRENELCVCVCIMYVYTTVSNFRVDVYSLLGYFYVPRFSDLERDYTHQKKKWSTNNACCVYGYYTAVDKLYACEREAKNAVVMYCGSKDRQFIGY